jgi:hypothetical protein
MLPNQNPRLAHVHAPTTSVRRYNRVGTTASVQPRRYNRVGPSNKEGVTQPASDPTTLNPNSTQLIVLTYKISQSSILKNKSVG